VVRCERSLCGDDLVRIAFLDESGRSAREKILVVASVMIHGDRSYLRIEEALRQLVTDTIPVADRDGFIFHATDLFHGSGYFQREKWPRERRYPILERLAALPKAFCLPVVFGHVTKADYRQEPVVVQHLEQQPEKDHRSDLLVIEHVTAFSRAVVGIEKQMRLLPRNEICMLVAEDTDHVKPMVKVAHAFLRDPSQIGKANWPEIDGLPLRKVVDTTHFAAKRDSALLQLADVCAFLLMRRLNRQDSTQPFFELLSEQLSWGCSDFGERMGTEQIGGGRLY
jgi:hypothetical protein